MNLIKVETVILNETTLEMDRFIQNPEKIAHVWKGTIEQLTIFDRDKEHLIVLMFDTKLNLTDWNLVSVGTLNQTIAHPRDILRPAIASNANGIAIMHNHPSGDITPSIADNKITKRIKDACEILQIKFHDHVIVTDRPIANKPPYYSFKDHGKC